MSELGLIEKIKKWIPKDLQSHVPVGDDAAVLGFPQGSELVYAVDAIVDGVDFYADTSKRKKPGFLYAALAGRKALAVNLSDLAAMGARPLACVISLGIPKHWKEAWLKDFYKGLTLLAGEFGVKCCGGDLTSSCNFFASVAVIGTVPFRRAVTRAGAQRGDWIAVTGALGGSLLRKHAQFQPRLKEAVFLAEQFKPTSMIDISDGFLQDLGHLLKNSRKGAEIEMLEIPISYDAVVAARKNPMQAFERACTDGEDFELLFTVSRNKKAALQKAWQRCFPHVALSWIGQINARRGKVSWRMNGKITAAPKFKKSGYQHFL